MVSPLAFFPDCGRIACGGAESLVPSDQRLDLAPDVEGFPVIQLGRVGAVAAGEGVDFVVARAQEIIARFAEVGVIVSAATVQRAARRLGLPRLRRGPRPKGNGRV